MASTVSLSAYSDALLILGTAGVIVPVVRRLGISPVLGYLGAGALLGPLALGALKQDVPLLAWLTISDPRSIAGIAELGVVFLLFLIGLELSFSRLMTMRRLVFGLGALQVTSATLVLSALLGLAGLGAAPAIIIGACLALSSTAIVIELLSAQGRMATGAGRAAFSILLAQDLAVVPILLIISMLAAKTGGSVLLGVVLALAQAALAVAVIVFVGRIGLRPLFRLVASAQSTELFMATTLFVIVGTSVLASAAGLPMALGAFVAGVMLAETEFRKAIQTHIEPFKGLLLGVFFFTVGMGIDLGAILANPLRMAGAVLALILIKGLLIFGLARAFGKSGMVALETAMLLAPGGEFAFVGIGAALAAGIVAGADATFALAVTSLSMVLVPVLANFARRIETWRARHAVADPALSAQPDAATGRAIVVGFGRVGQVVAAMLERHGVAMIATDSDPHAVMRARRDGAPVFFGNATNPDYLRTLGLMEARAVIITIHTAPVIDEIVRVIRAIRPDVPIVSRARDAQHAAHLYAIGVSDAVPETIEASLQLSEAALVGLDVPMGLVIASIHEKRDEFRAMLRQARG